MEQITATNFKRNIIIFMLGSVITTESNQYSSPHRDVSFAIVSNAYSFPHSGVLTPLQVMNIHLHIVEC